MSAVICLVRTALPANLHLVTAMTRLSPSPCSCESGPNSSRLPRICSWTVVTMLRLLCCVNLSRSSISLGRSRQRTRKVSVGFAARGLIGSSSLLQPNSGQQLATAFGVRTTVTIANSVAIPFRTQACCSEMTPSCRSYSYLTSWGILDESGTISRRGLGVIHTANTFTRSTRRWRSGMPNGRLSISWSTCLHHHEPESSRAQQLGVALWGSGWLVGARLPCAPGFKISPPSGADMSSQEAETPPKTAL